MKIPLERSAAAPLYRQIADYIDQQITAGNLPIGALLPPIRTLAEQLGVSKTIISMAYDELQAAGRVMGRVGQGTVVTTAAPVPVRARLPLALPQQGPGGAVLNDLIKLDQQRGLINFTTDRPAPELLPDAVFGRCLRAVMQQDGAAAYAYDAPEGHGPLRQAIARHVVDRGIVANPEEVLVTAGAQQALDLAVRGLVAPGEWVVVESPSFLWAHNTLAVHGVRAAPAPVDEGGLAVDQLEPLLRRLRPRLLYTIPTGQNPTGTTLSLQRRRRLVELAARWDVVVLEDAVCSELDLVGSAPPALRALGNHVVHAGSFSKSLLPGIRMGYAVAVPEVVRRLALVKQASDVHSPGVLQRALARFLDGGHFAPHLRRVQEEYRRRRGAALAAVARYFPAGTRWTEPAGGLHVWVTLPPELNTTELYVAAIGAGVGFTPGAIFYPPGAPSHHLRISYGAEPPPRIAEGIARLGDLLAQGAAGGRVAGQGSGRRAGALM